MNIEAFFKVTYGLYIISAEQNGQKSGYVGNTAFQVTAEPARFAISCSKDNYSVDVIRKSKAFSMSVIEKYDNAELMGLFGFQSTSDIDKFQNTEHLKGPSGSPVVTENCIAWFDCKLEQEVELDTHVIFIGRVIASEILDSRKEPLTYAFYREVKKGMAPKNAPTYIDKKLLEEKEEVSAEAATEGGGEIHECDLCGYEYDPAVGDPENGIPPGTPFEDLPDDWECPICGAGKEDFSKA